MISGFFIGVAHFLVLLTITAESEGSFYWGVFYHILTDFLEVIKIYDLTVDNIEHNNYIFTKFDYYNNFMNKYKAYKEANFVNLNYYCNIKYYDNFDENYYNYYNDKINNINKQKVKNMILIVCWKNMIFFSYITIIWCFSSL